MTLQVERVYGPSARRVYFPLSPLCLWHAHVTLSTFFVGYIIATKSLYTTHPVRICPSIYVGSTTRQPVVFATRPPVVFAPVRPSRLFPFIPSRFWDALVTVSTIFCVLCYSYEVIINEIHCPSSLWPASASGLQPARPPCLRPVHPPVESISRSVRHVCGALMSLFRQVLMDYITTTKSF